MKNRDRLAFWTDERAIPKATLDKLMIGWDSRLNRYTLPVLDADGACVDVKRYRTDLNPKNIHTKGYGSPTRIFGADRLAKASTDVGVIVCGGEPDAIKLVSLGFLAVSGTSGEGAVPRREDLELLRGRPVNIIYDQDDPGRKGSAKVVAALVPIAKSVRNVTWPLADGKDVTDWLLAGRTKADLIELVRATPRAVPQRKRRAVRSLLEWAIYKDLPATASRNLTGFNLAAQLRDERYPRDEAEQVLTVQYLGMVAGAKDEPYTREEALASLEQAYSQPAREPSGITDDDDRPYSKLGQILSRGDLRNLPKPEPLIDDWLDLGTAVVMAGATGTNKTFALLGWACSVATGTPWLDHAVRIDPSPAIVVVGEGASGLDDRITAWEEEHGIKVPDGMLKVLKLPASINDATFWDQLTDYCREVGARFVALDTFSSLAPDANETDDAAKAVRWLTELATVINGVAVLAHHTGWSAKDRTRGGSQFEANPDSVIVLQMHDESDPESPVEVWRKKDKDGPSGLKLWVRRKYVGDSCVLETTDAPLGAKVKGGSTAEFKRRDDITQALRDGEEFTLTRTAAVVAAGGTRPLVRKTLEIMISNGEVPVKQERYQRANGKSATREVLGHVRPVQAGNLLAQDRSGEES